MLKGNNISLRALEPSDVNVLYRWENDTATWKVSNTMTPFSKHVIEQYIATSHQDIYTSRQLRLMICDKDANPVGCIDLFDYDPSHHRAGIGILIADEAERRKGYASEALQLLTKYCQGTLQLHQLYCNIISGNESSIKLFITHKFEITGVKKQWIKAEGSFVDELLLQLILTK